MIKKIKKLDKFLQKSHVSRSNFYSNVAYARNIAGILAYGGGKRDSGQEISLFEKIFLEKILLQITIYNFFKKLKDGIASL